MKAEFLETTKDGQKVCAFLFYDNGKIWGKPVGGGTEILIETILKDDVVVKDKIINRRDDPEAWFKGLRHQYNGSYLRAALIEE